jgi:hypothetical protein
MKSHILVDNTMFYARKLLLVAITLIILALAWTVIFMDINSTAIAATLDDSSVLVSLNTTTNSKMFDSDMGDRVKDKVEEGIDTLKMKSDRLQDRAEEKIDTTNKNLDKTLNPNGSGLKRANLETQKNIQEGKKELYDAEEALRNRS